MDCLKKQLLQFKCSRYIWPSHNDVVTKYPCPRFRLACLEFRWYGQGTLKRRSPMPDMIGALWPKPTSSSSICSTHWLTWPQEIWRLWRGPSMRPSSPSMSTRETYLMTWWVCCMMAKYSEVLLTQTSSLHSLFKSIDHNPLLKLAIFL